MAMLDVSAFLLIVSKGLKYRGSLYEPGSSTERRIYYAFIFSIAWLPSVYITNARQQKWHFPLVDETWISGNP